MRILASALLLASCFLATACNDANIADVPTATCLSGSQWNGGNHGSSNMNPGQDCIACHAGNGGPNYVFAGTVFGDLTQANNCFGESGVQVILRGADGNEMTLTSNDAGNFYSRQALALPYTARVIANGKESVMLTPQQSGACNSCHGQTPLNGAPGRVVAP